MNVKTRGALGDGVALDTPAIQRAINACATGGGGRVVFPAGHYLTGSFPLVASAHMLTLRNREGGTRVAALVMVRKDRPFDPARDFQGE